MPSSRFVFVFVLVGCTKTPPSDPILAAPAPPPVPVDASAPKHTDDAAAPPAGPVPRVGIQGSTKGTIACGPWRCKVGDEICILAKNAWQCIPREAESRTPSDESYACDDASDCPDTGMTCCVSHGFRRERTECSPKDAVDSYPCTLELCDSGEGAARCPTGQACKDGFCRPPGPTLATCSKDTKCPADKPICRWADGGGTCIDAAESAKIHAELEKDPAAKVPSTLACTKPRDCGAGQTCCIVRDPNAVSPDPGDAIVTECRAACDDFLFEATCERDRECMPFMTFGANSRVSRAFCKPRPASKLRPAWIGTCRAP